MTRRYGILTAGGDCPGLNAVIRGAVLKGETVHGQQFVGLLDGWRGLVHADVVPLSRMHVRGIGRDGGTILGTSRFGLYSEDTDGAAQVALVMEKLGLDGIVAIGGEGTAAAAKRLHDDGINVVGVPKTIDNDVDATDYTFGFDTAVEIATEAIDRLHTTGNAHHRCMVLEVMGRHAGWIALHAGIAGGAHVILIPEQTESITQICHWVRSVADRGRSPMVVVAEGFRLPDMAEAHCSRGQGGSGHPRLGGIADVLAPLIEQHTGIETRATILGHIQRGGSPTAFDRVLATRLGMAVTDLLADGAWGQMVALRGTTITRVGFDVALAKHKSVPLDAYEEARVLFG